MTEHDPSGKSAHESGAKLDDGKLQVELVLGGFPNALESIAAVGTFGALKYTPDGWKDVPNALVRYANAAGRHRLKRQQREIYDPQTGILHLAHEAWNVLAALEFEIQQRGGYGSILPVKGQDGEDHQVVPLDGPPRLDDATISYDKIMHSGIIRTDPNNHPNLSMD